MIESVAAPPLKSVAATWGDAEGQGLEVHVDFIEPIAAEREADRVKELYDQGLLIKQIARRIGHTRNFVHKSLVWWYISRGLPAPDTKKLPSPLA